MREGTVNVNLEESVALSNKPLQRLNASAARSSAGRAATPRAGARGSSRPWYDRATVRRSPLNGKTLARPAIMTKPDVNEQLRGEWRELGFFYDSDDQTKEWRLVGSRAGLLRFRDRLLGYASNPKNETVSEHEHYWPYGYLEVMTWPQAGMDSHAIRGTLTDLRRLATLIERAAASAQSGSVVRIREEYAVDGDYALVLEFRDDDFDPASADPGLAHGAG